VEISHFPLLPLFWFSLFHSVVVSASLSCYYIHLNRTIFVSVRVKHKGLECALSCLPLSSKTIPPRPLQCSSCLLSLFDRFSWSLSLDMPSLSRLDPISLLLPVLFLLRAIVGKVLFQDFCRQSHSPATLCRGSAPHPALQLSSMLRACSFSEPQVGPPARTLRTIPARSCSGTFLGGGRPREL